LEQAAAQWKGIFLRKGNTFPAAEYEKGVPLQAISGPIFNILYSAPPVQAKDSTSGIFFAPPIGDGQFLSEKICHMNELRPKRAETVKYFFVDMKPRFLYNLAVTVLVSISCSSLRTRFPDKKLSVKS
jgi:hypothetical protein